MPGKHGLAFSLSVVDPERPGDVLRPAWEPVQRGIATLQLCERSGLPAMGGAGCLSTDPLMPFYIARCDL